MGVQSSTCCRERTIDQCNRDAARPEFWVRRCSPRTSSSPIPSHQATTCRSPSPSRSTTPRRASWTSIYRECLRAWSRRAADFCVVFDPKWFFNSVFSKPRISFPQIILAKFGVWGLGLTFDNLGRPELRIHLLPQLGAAGKSGSDVMCVMPGMKWLVWAKGMYTCSGWILISFFCPPIASSVDTSSQTRRSHRGLRGR